MGGADLAQTGRGSLQIAMVTAHTGIPQLLQLLATQQSQRSTEKKVGMLPQLAIIGTELLQRLATHLASTGHLTETLHPFALIVLCLLEHLLRTYDVVGIGMSSIMGRLRTPLAVFRALAGPGVDDAARIEGRFAIVTGYLSRRLIERFPLHRLTQGISLLFGKLDSFQNPLLQLINPFYLFFHKAVYLVIESKVSIE